jgi:hypothetical protein
MRAQAMAIARIVTKRIGSLPARSGAGGPDGAERASPPARKSDEGPSPSPGQPASALSASRGSSTLAPRIVRYGQWSGLVVARPGQ